MRQNPPPRLRRPSNAAEKYLSYQRKRGGFSALEDSETTLRDLQQAAAGEARLEASQRLALYQRVRWFTRNLVLQDPRVTSQPLLFLQRNRFICQMLHEYMGY